MRIKRGYSRGQHPNCRNGFKLGHHHSEETKRKISERHKGNHHSPDTEFKKGEMSDEKHLQWKGDEATYTAKHQWIRRKLGTPNYCKFCGTEEIRRYHWASISGEYKRDIADWMRLCVPCHKRHDIENNKRLQS